MDSMDDRALARLIAEREGLSVLDKEALFEQVLARVERRPARASGIARWAAALATLGGLAVAIGLFLRSGPAPFPATWDAPTTWDGPNGPKSGNTATWDEPTPRGAEGPSGPSFALRCLRDGADSPCSVGSTLAFEMQNVHPELYFAAWATGADGRRIWYLPRAGDRGRSVAVDPQQRLLRAAVELGPEHVAARYQVVGLFSDQALAREQLEVFARGGALPVGAVLVQRELRLEASP